MDQSAALAVARAYDVELTAWSHLHGGQENTSYRLATSRGERVLTVLEKRPVAEAAVYADFLQRLNEARLPAPEIYADRSGRRLIEVLGRPAILSQFVAGEHVHPLADGQLREIGSILARLHTSGLDCGLAPHVRITPDRAASALGSEDSAFAEWFGGLHADLGHPLEDGPATPTHGDLFPDNILASPTGRLTLLDWEDCARHSPLVDFASAAFGLCCDDTFHPPRLAAILQGYRQAGGAFVDGDRLLAAIVYFGLFSAQNRLRLAQRAPRGATPRDWRELRRRLDSIRCGWGRL